jgi:hypothetical protein
VTAKLSRLTRPESPAFWTIAMVSVPAARLTGTLAVDHVSHEAVGGRLICGPAAPLMRVDSVRVVDWPSLPTALA